MTQPRAVRRFGVMTNTTTSRGERVAIITGASRGLGLALARDLAAKGWRLVLDARGGESLARVCARVGRGPTVGALTGAVVGGGDRVRPGARAARPGRPAQRGG